MSNPHPAYRLELTRYPRQDEMETRFSDMDAYAHLNNGAIGRFYEHARAKMQIAIHQRTDLYRANNAHRFVLLETRMRFLHEGHFPEPVVAGTGIGRLGNSSYEVHQALFQNNRCIGLCETIMVHLLHSSPSPLEGKMRQRFEAMLITPP